jgi:pimeloyl-ACP methyl ester carboxylesterase
VSEVSVAASFVENPLVMTLSTIAISPSKNLAKEEMLTIIPGRSNTPLIEKKWGKVGFTFQIHKNKKAPVVFIIPGTGGSHKSTTSGFIAERLFSEGYHTVTVDSAFNWRFVVGGSASAIPGYMPQDAEDLYRVLLKIKEYLRVGHGVRSSGYSLVGYSMGGLHGLFIKRLDDERKDFSFDRVLLVNPPIDLLHGVRALDGLFEMGESLGKQGQKHTFGRLFDVGAKILEKDGGDLKTVDLQNVVDSLNYSDRDYAYLISFSFRSSLRDVIYASQQVKDLGILKKKATRWRQNARLEEAYGISFTEYMTSFVLPYAQKKQGSNYTLEELNRDSSMYQFEGMIKNDPRVLLVHSQDDFLLADADTQWIAETFGQRAVIFPYGGHCGNIAFPQFTEFLKQVF